MNLNILHTIQAQSFYMLLIISLSSIIKIHAAGNETDRVALVAFKNSISQDPKKALASWNDSSLFCNWEGVRCDQQKRVISLELHDKGLVGPMSPAIGNLSSLQSLRIYNNSLHGEIPPELGRLSGLQELDLSMNNFTGEIPVNIFRCSDLRHLSLGRNSLVGKLPEELGALSKLTDLGVELNSLAGEIPLSIGNLTYLETLSAAYNQFQGSIPNTIGQLKNLSFLGLGFNSLSGMIPSSFYNLSSLTILSLGQNQLQGSPLPPVVGLMFPRLEFIDLSNNGFTGSLPLSFANFPELRILQLNGNNFFGKIAIDFGGLKNLKILALGQNSLGSGELDEMNFIDSLANCTNLNTLDVSSNKLRGVLPDFIGNLSRQLYLLDLQENQLYGRLPSTIGNLIGLASLRLQNNNFNGSIPSTIGNLVKLQRIHLQTNEFSGRIPDSIGNLSILSELRMEMNGLEGIIPINLRNCRRLILLELSQNNLSGPIPKELFELSALSISLNLSGNHLYGSLPLEVGNLKNLGSLDLSKNDLYGKIPSSLGSCISLEILYLQENTFQGSIPSSMSSLRGVTRLDLSHNNFSGQIPGFFEQFSMKYLNLSYNDFDGEVPVQGVFANQRAISVVGNNKLCGGIPELNLRKCSVEESNKQGKSYALIIVISAIGTLLCVVAIGFCFLFYQHKKTRKVQSSIRISKESSLGVSYEELHKATDGFSLENLVGRGSSSYVYKGIFYVDEVVVAVKVLNLQSREVYQSFMIACESLRSVRHQNLVNIVTYCSDIDLQGNDFKALVYDFMTKGSLERWLHSIPKDQNEPVELHRLGLLERINIAIDVASALDYLHNKCAKTIIHCDIKPSNVLLDKDMVAHVGDFGMEKFLVPEVTDIIPGAVGYAAPEYGMGSAISTMGDVYSYGILILEMMTGKRPIDPMFSEGLNLHNFAKMSLPGRVMEILDPIIVNDIPEKYSSIMKEYIISLVKIGVACSMEVAKDRMDIRVVILELNLLRKNLLGALNGA